MPEQEGSEANVLTRLFRHNTWANLALLEFCAGLTDEQLDAKAVGGYGSLRETLAHLVSAEVNYLDLAIGKTPPVPLPEDRFPGFAALRDAVRWAGDELLQVASTAPEGAIVRTERPQEPIYEYPLAGLMVQVLDHATWHRAQVAMNARHLGLVPPSVSGWGYMRALGEFREFSSDASTPQ